MKHLNDYTTEKLLDIYQNLYEMNLEGAEDEYLEEYEHNYSSNAMFPETPSKEDVVTGLGRLIAKLINDTGDSALVDGWTEQAAGNDTGFHDEFLKAVAELREMRVR